MEPAAVPANESDRRYFGPNAGFEICNELRRLYFVEKACFSPGMT